MAAYEIPGFSFTLEAAVDWSDEATTGQYRFVSVDANGRAAAPSANGQAIGVRQNTPPQFGATTIVCSGIVWVEANAAVTAGDKVTTDADGTGNTAASTDVVLGTALTGAGASGELMSVLLGTDNPVAP